MARSFKGIAATVVFVVAMSGVTSVHAFPSLNLQQSLPDIFSSFLSASYNAGTGELVVQDAFPGVVASVQNIATGGGTFNVAGGTFTLNAVIDELNQTVVSGDLTITGTAAGAGLPTSTGILLTADLARVGEDVRNLEFLFNVTSGDASSLFGPTAGVILASSGFNAVSNGGLGFADIGTAFGAMTDTFASAPAPSTLVLMLLGCGWLALRRRWSGAALG